MPCPQDHVSRIFPFGPRRFSLAPFLSSFVRCILLHPPLSCPRRLYLLGIVVSTKKSGLSHASIIPVVEDQGHTLLFVIESPQEDYSAAANLSRLY